MTIEELNEYVLVNSNQYYIGESNVEVDLPVLSGLVTRALSIFGNYRPVVSYSEINIDSQEQKIKTHNGSDVLNISNLYVTHPMLTQEPIEVSTTWKYIRDNNTLYTSLMTGSVYAKIFTIPKLDDIGYSELQFLNIVIGLYLQYIGSVRKGFTLDDIPISNDGSELYAKGEELVAKAIEDLQTFDSTWYTAIE